MTVDATCTLPLAVAYADGTVEPACGPGTASGTTTINLPAGIYILSAPLSLTANTIIDGAGASSTTISGNDAVQVLSVNSGATVEISGVTITGGVSGVSTIGCSVGSFGESCPYENGLDGGGISNAGTLTLASTVITGNVASAGRAPHSQIFSVCVSNCPPSAGQDAGNGGSGGAIANSGTLTVDDSTVSNNLAGGGGDGTSGVSGTGSGASAGQNGGYGGDGGDGGAIDNETGATLTIAGSTLSGNAAGAGGSGGSGSDATEAAGAGGAAGSAGHGGQGGALYNTGTFTVSGSTIVNNTTGTGLDPGRAGSGSGGEANGANGYGGVGGSGGGIWTGASVAGANALLNVTIASNTTGQAGIGNAAGYSGVGGSGGGIYDSGEDPLQLNFVTIADNLAVNAVGGVEDNGGGAITEADSIIASNSGLVADNCSIEMTGTTNITDNGNNVVFGDYSCPGTYADPKLDVIQDNGGPTQTIGLQPGSAAIDEVPSSSCLTHVDQRGVSRPQGAGCDAGAYEVAAPSVSDIFATSSSQTGATVSASVNPNASHSDTTVMVEYGTGAGYGSRTGVEDIGRGIGAVPSSANLSGLQSATTYHFDIVATNADGTTTTSDGTFTTASAALAAPRNALAAAISSTAHFGSALNLKIACSGGDSDGICKGKLTLTSHVSSRGKQIVAISADATPKLKTKRRTVTVGSGSYSVTTGHSKVITLQLNSTGRELLAARYRLLATLSITGTDTIKRTVAFSYVVITSPIASNWMHGPHSTTVTKLALDTIPAGSNVLVSCQGGGCPFAKRSFAVKSGKIALASGFKHSKLRPGASVEIEVTHSGYVGKVEIFTMRAGADPKLVKRCFVPGEPNPSVCAR